MAQKWEEKFEPISDPNLVEADMISDHQEDSPPSQPQIQHIERPINTFQEIGAFLDNASYSSNRLLASGLDRMSPLDQIAAELHQLVQDQNIQITQDQVMQQVKTAIGTCNEESMQFLDNNAFFGQHGRFSTIITLESHYQFNIASPIVNSSILISFSSFYPVTRASYFIMAIEDEIDFEK